MIELVLRNGSHKTGPFHAAKMIDQHVIGSFPAKS